MTFGSKKSFLWVATLCGLVLCGCDPGGAVAVDEEKEPQFLIGRSRVNAMNFSGAVEAFEQALELNPHSGAAHFELGWLYAEKEADPAAAIYHYQKYLALRPNASNAETIRQHVFRLKQELAKAVLPIPPTPELQRQLEQLTEERRHLQEEVDRLRSALTPGAPPVNRSSFNPNHSIGAGNSDGIQREARNRIESAPGRAGSYRVQSGDTLVAIARRYRISLESLQAANPGVDPRRMQVGQSVRIPQP